ncbi:MAG: hypothetical protein A3F42_02420 [Gammaproteobacteria bacterium RIFCSPHIGHO2_12_FULL_37_34]|nr:MAG: hypothetical protein A3F42_02420 [Gammaproteobacteria bacterium RIFCSPHIGHO2_12_FULL_37_34]
MEEGDEIAMKKKMKLKKNNKKNMQRALFTKAEFLSNMSHDLRTPINGIIGFTELILYGKTGDITPEQKEYLSDIVSCASQLLAIINELLDIAKLEAGMIEFKPAKVDVIRVLKRTLDVFNTLIIGKNISLEIKVDPAVNYIIIDSTKFKQVIYNYVSNAFKFTYPGGHIIIRVRPDKSNFFRLEVEDTGIGIRQEDIPKLFIAFQKVDKDSINLEEHISTGLGLALTRQIVESQGGRVGVESVWKKGSIFYAILPCSPL